MFNRTVPLCLALRGILCLLTNAANTVVCKCKHGAELWKVCLSVSRHTCFEIVFGKLRNLFARGKYWTAYREGMIGYTSVYV